MRAPPDAALAEHCAARAAATGARQRGDHVAGAGGARADAQEKTPIPRGRDEAERAAWHREAAALDPAALVVLDETSTPDGGGRR